jgi:hypothetical protein
VETIQLLNDGAKIRRGPDTGCDRQHAERRFLSIQVERRAQ